MKSDNQIIQDGLFAKIRELEQELKVYRYAMKFTASCLEHSNESHVKKTMEVASANFPLSLIYNLEGSICRSFFDDSNLNQDEQERAVKMIVNNLEESALTELKRINL